MLLKKAKDTLAYIGLPKLWYSGFESTDHFLDLNKYFVPIIDHNEAFHAEHKRPSRKWCFISQDKGLVFVRSRVSDIVRDVWYGEYILGYATSDYIKEHNLTVDEEYRIVSYLQVSDDDVHLGIFAHTDDDIHSWADLKDKTIVTPYPNTLRNFLYAQEIYPVKIIYRRGGIEPFVASGIVDAWFDIISTGNSYRDNNLSLIWDHVSREWSIWLVWPQNYATDEKKQKATDYINFFADEIQKQKIDTTLINALNSLTL